MLATLTKAQVYGNTWINYSQQYVKFPISKEGIYRIDSLTLSTHYNLATTNPQNFQLFIKGKEQALFIKGDGDGKINTGDYLEFYASPYMGDIDSLLYWNIKYLPNPYAPIFNDTIYGFLTLNNSVSNKRYQLETDTNSVLYEAADHFYAQKTFTGKNNYNKVLEYTSEVSDPRYTQAEGYGVLFNKGASISSAFSNLNTYTNAPLPASLTINFSGNSIENTVGIDHQIQTYFNDQSLTPILLKDTTFHGYQFVRQTFTLNSQNTTSNTNFTLISVSSPSFASFTNSSILHYISYYYPQSLTFNNQPFQKLYIDNSISSTKNFYNFNGFNLAGSSGVLLYDLTNFKKITATISGSMLRAVIPDAAGRKLCVLAAESQTINVNTLRKVNNQTGLFTNFKNAGGTKPFVIIYNKITKNGAQSYQTYRQTIPGGSFNVILADIDELYEQFCFGINRHPLSITNFARFLNDSLPNKPNYFFLIGKSIGCDYLYPSSPENLIPTIGIPSSDNMLMSNLSSTTTSFLIPEIPVGRLAATTNSEVMVYLAKVQQHESSAPAEWKKKVLHFVGGDDLPLNNLLSSYMSSYEQVISDTSFGGNVITFKKNTTAPIQINISDSIKNTISDGAALINFFGHGSEQGFDQAIDDPEQYNNTARYPFIIANACYSGNIHVAGRKSVSERFVFSNQRGSIGFLAATAYGFVHALNNYDTWFYEALGRTRYNYGIGDVIKETILRNTNTADSLIKFTGLDMTLHGDPAIKITNGALPDYRIQNNSVSFNTKKYTDSIGITIHITNLGRAVRDSFFVRVERYYPNGDSAIIYKRIQAPYFKDTLKFFVLLDFNRGVGLNKFTVKVDDYNEIPESLENNNSTTGTVDLFIPGGDILPVYPYKFAVVPKTTTIALKASTTDPFAPSNTYHFQLDTCDKFASPIQSAIISSKGGVLEWVVNLPFKDSTVYFWRVSRDSSSSTSSFVWHESSFQTINTQRGWGQAHFNQFKNDGYQYVNYKKQLRKFVFENSKQSIACRDFFQNSINVSTNINWFFNNITMSSWGCGPNGWNFALLDYTSGQPDEVVSTNYPAAGYGPYNNYVCVSNQVLRVYSFGAYDYNCQCSPPNWKTNMENFLNAIPPNKYVLAYTIDDAQISTYSNSLYNAFESIGAVSIRNTSDTVPYILFGRKGMTAGQGHEVKGINKSSIITLTDSIQTRWNNGYIASELIGPSYQWNSLHWRVESEDLVPGDTTVIKVIGYKSNGQIDTLAAYQQDAGDIVTLGNIADASVYPYLKLIAYMKDNVKTTSP
ncbi:MAG: hypothetical protein JWO32_2993, partial [Bacteroidetes bacterium]|nr:hypothetical protein [Bacteroidota bacterium]